MKYKSLFCLCLFAIASFSSSAEELKRRNIEPELSCLNGPVKIKDQSEFYLLFGDYTEEDETLKVISRKPLKIHVYAEVFSGDLPEVKDHLVKKALISNAYRVFAFSDIDKITVTSSAKEISITNGVKNVKQVKSPTYTITKTRSQALSDLRKFTNAKSFDDLFEKDQICQFSPVFKQFLYDDQGGNGITKFFNQVKK
ncbi:TPA: hypothetical protein QH556_000564 [Klebsiella variicola]|uniref:hypothetical protein n=1 Tax=Klebsiella quasipneumoniae TaxID=1463165 RepID=UPI001FB5A642|nr:hypothetical protein [Klebsiella quasipneumoniae]HDK6909784.1 hypothetical protein [Klebsiella pneumoniae]HDS7653435.1 hypothetical protein [Klebsiella variicola]MCJ1810592.1 hypothetical protein [Klebsiella quasipneumoniae subsp. similipneumoniae]HDT2400514.1 hypothetical protein [Klebsiella pneumoniae]HDU5589336.1 hypothetical protein [Klebsiella variicola]